MAEVSAPVVPTAPAAQPNGAAKPPAEATPEERASTARYTPPGAAPGKATKQPQQAKPEGDSPPGEKDAAKKEEELFEYVTKGGEKRQLTKEQALRKLARDEAADISFREAKELTRKNQQLVEMLKDPERFEEAASQLGHDLDELAKRRLSKAVEKAQMTPEQQEVARLKAELEKYQGDAKKREAEAAKAKQEEDDKAAFAHFEKGFLAAAEKHGIEGTPANLERIVEIAAEAMDLGIPLTEDQVMAELKEREDATFAKLEQRVTKGLKGEALAKRLGPGVVEEVLRWSVEKLRGGPPAQPKPAAEEAPAEKKKPTPYISETDFRKRHGF